MKDNYYTLGRVEKIMLIQRTEKFTCNKGENDEKKVLSWTSKETAKDKQKSNDKIHI